MLRRLSLFVALLVTACAASPAFAQAPATAHVPEPVVAPGEIAVRLLNATDCLIAVRAKANGDVIRGGTIAPHQMGWVHTRSIDGVVQEIEIVVSPKLCGVDAPTLDSARAPRLDPVRKASWRRS